MARLFVISGDDIGRSYDLQGDNLVMGRGKDADLTVHGASVSRMHARLERTGAGWRLVDLGSSNGIRVSGMKVGGAELADGETFHLGEVELRLRFEPKGAPEPSFAESAAEADFAPADSPEPEPSRAEPEPEDLELEGDWDANAELSAPVRSAPQPKPSKPSPQPAQQPPQQGRDKAARRAQAMGGAAAPGAQATSSGGRILQYQKVDNRSGMMGTEMGQQTGMTRLLMYALVALLCSALAYGAYTLTTASRRNAALVNGE